METHIDPEEIPRSTHCIMKFYVPEWDDRVDADYDFIHDEHSALDTKSRNNAYIWDIFNRESTPIDGVLISREQVEQSTTKYDKLTTNGVYNEEGLDIPTWIPTISDCGAWGYKSLPFPPYGNAEMLEFYEQMNVTAGVTIDHLVLGSGHTARLYLDKRAFGNGFSPGDLPSTVTDEFDVMIDTWPEEWPDYVYDDEPSLYHSGPVEPFDPSLFDGSLESILTRLSDDPRAVFRDDDMAYRYGRTLDNAREMKNLYDTNGYSFRLMSAIQGWDEDSYVRATESVLEMGYQYLGIGGVAGSTTEDVKSVVTAIGNAIYNFERSNRTRVDAHVFGFAKTDAFETIGRSGMTSFDSASMLRAAWTGPENYHLDSGRKFDAIRIRYPQNGEDLKLSIRKSLRAQEVLHSLRAYDRGSSIADALQECHQSAESSIENVLDYLENHRFDEQFDSSLLREVEESFREDYRYAQELKANFSNRFRRRLIKLLRSDDPENPVPWSEYLGLVSTAREVFDDVYPTSLAEIERHEQISSAIGSFEQLWPLIEAYVGFIGDSEHLQGYRELLMKRPWEECSCPICDDLGIEVAIFRGNNRNRRRGFHNTRRFFDEFEEVLPKLLIAIRGSTRLLKTNTVEDYLSREFPELWNSVHDIPVAEIGVITANGVHEWWEKPPESLSFDPDQMLKNLADHFVRYDHIYLIDDGSIPLENLQGLLGSGDYHLHTFSDPVRVREAIKGELKFPLGSQLSSY